jgi:hypothetical protein
LNDFEKRIKGGIFIFLIRMMQVEANIKEDVRKYFKYYENEIIPVIKTIPEVTQKDY